MADDQARKFIDSQLSKAGVKPTEGSVLDYAMCTVELLCQMNMKLHERIRDLEGQLKRRRSRAYSRSKTS